MSSSSVVIERSSVTWLSLACDYLELTKPRIGVLVLITVAVASYVASWGQPNLWLLIHTLIGSGLVAASTGALNQWLEQKPDSLMRRTVNRPLPAGRLSSKHVLTFGFLTAVFGMAYLVIAVNTLTAFWGFLTWFLYLAIYTPLKQRTWLNTVVGAVAGALPILMGWSGVGGELSVRAAAMFLILFLWQFPHFMAIAWIYRQQYERAGFKMLTVVDPSGERAGVQAVLSALALLPISFVPGFFAPPPACSLYVTLAFVLGVGQLICAVLFLALRTETSARILLRASLIYLPALWVLLMFVPVM